MTRQETLQLILYTCRVMQIQTFFFWHDQQQMYVFVKLMNPQLLCCVLTMYYHSFLSPTHSHPTESDNDAL